MFQKLFTVLKPGHTLSQRTSKGVFWISSLKITNKLVQLLRIIVLARILSPDDFGLLGISLLAIYTLDMISNLGFTPALIQRDGEIQDYLDTAWIISVVRGIFLAILLFVTAPILSSFFNNPRAVPIMQALAISLVLRGFTNIGIVYFQRELDFKAIFIYTFSITLVDTAVSLFLAVYLRNIWALVWGLLAGNAVGLFVSYVIHPYRPKLKFYLGKAKELFHFGKWLMLNSIMYFFVENIDSIFVAKFLGSIPLGYYQLGYRFSSIPSKEVGGVVYEVAFPAFSRLKNSLVKRQDMYFKAMRLISLLVIPFCGLLLVLSEDFTRVFLGEKWLPMVPVLKILTIGSFIAGISEINTPFLQAIGKPEIPAKQSGIRLVVFCFLVYPLSSWLGLSGVALAVVIAEIIKQPLGYRFIFKTNPAAAFKILKILSPSLVCALLAFLLVVFLKNLFVQIGVFHFIILTGSFLSFYLASLYLIDRFSGRAMISTLKYLFQSMTS